MEFKYVDEKENLEKILRSVSTSNTEAETEKVVSTLMGFPDYSFIPEHILKIHVKRQRLVDEFVDYNRCSFVEYRNYSEKTQIFLKDGSYFNPPVESENVRFICGDRGYRFIRGNESLPVITSSLLFDYKGMLFDVLNVTAMKMNLKGLVNLNV